MKYTILYECKDSYRVEQEVVDADKVLQAVVVLKAAGCQIKAVVLKR